MLLNSPLIVVLPDIRSAQNVGSIFRTADAVGVTEIITCGYTPHPSYKNDPRPAHVADSNRRAIAKTALGAETTVPHRHFDGLEDAISYLRKHNYIIAALEQAENSTNLFEYAPAGPVALLLGNEVEGLSPAILAKADVVLELPMIGAKESLNVSVAAAIAMYQLTRLTGVRRG